MQIFQLSNSSSLSYYLGNAQKYLRILQGGKGALFGRIWSNLRKKDPPLFVTVLHLGVLRLILGKLTNKHSTIEF